MLFRSLAEPKLLVQGNASPHTFSLRPSDARLLAEAGLVVMVDDGLEGFLAKPLATLAGKAEVVEMSTLPGITLLARREGGVWEKHAHDQQEEHEEEHDEGPDHDDHDHDGHDPHLWLDPANARVLVEAVAAKLAKMDPANAATYAANADKYLASLDGLDATLHGRLAPVKGVPYVVFHDAYQYFEHRYGLSAAGSVTLDPERPPSANRLAQLRDRLKAAKVRCVFREPQFPAAVVQRLADSAGARVAMLDPLGSELPAGPAQYTALLGQLGGNLSQCLSGK